MPTPEGRALTIWRLNRWESRGDLSRGSDGNWITTVVTDLKWQPVGGLWPLAITIGGNFATLAAQLLVTNQEVRPLDTDNDYPPLVTFTERRSYTLEQPYFWIKLLPTTLTGGELRASFMAAGQGG